MSGYFFCTAEIKKIATKAQRHKEKFFIKKSLVSLCPGGKFSFLVPAFPGFYLPIKYSSFHPETANIIHKKLEVKRKKTRTGSVDLFYLTAAGVYLSMFHKYATPSFHSPHSSIHPLTHAATNDQ